MTLVRRSRAWCSAQCSWHAGEVGARRVTVRLPVVASPIGRPRRMPRPCRPHRSGSAELRDPVPLKVTAEVGGKRAAYTGMGECHHTTDASIYEVPATMWSAHVTAESATSAISTSRSGNPKGSSDTQVSLDIAVGGDSHDVATVKGSSPKGSGSGRADAKGAGGSLQVEGTGCRRHSRSCHRGVRAVDRAGRRRRLSSSRRYCLIPRVRGDRR